MSFLRLVPLLCGLLLPFQALAQASAPSQGPATPPPIVSAPDTPGEPQGEIIPPGERLNSEDTGSPVLRIPVGILVGTVGALVGTLPGLAIVATQFCLDSCSDDQSVEIFGLVVASAGALLAGTWAIDRVGDWLGGQGRFWPTALGMVLGTVVGSVVAVAIAPSSEGASVVPAVLGPALGGAIAYEISSAMVRSEAMAASASRPRIAPLVAVSPRGGFIGGLAGTF
ncbi:MAG TPA: hypothetical protein VK539_35620 [Myxococcaceae bacterium]|nr:hypothetical protein [Myxococcaceae bacterium]